MVSNNSPGISITGNLREEYSSILTPAAIDFVGKLQRRFNATRLNLLKAREERQKRIEKGELPDFLPGTRSIRESDWKVAAAPQDLNDRRVEITGPVEKKMMINALNSGARVFMADLEDANSPTWANCIEGQINLREAVRRTLQFTSPEGKIYKLNEKIATLLVRPRGWHLNEKHVTVDGDVMSGSLFDFGLYFFHNAHELLKRGSGPYFYLPKMESHLEARLWNEVFNFSQDELKIPRGTIRATVLIETILAAFEMEEILFELKDHAAGLNAGRWDYIFSFIKKFCKSPDRILPDRAQITMTIPFMRAYSELLVKSCHRHGAHAIGGMAAFIPSRRDVQVNEVALAKVREDKERESGDGFDGTWVAHPDLVAIAQEKFDRVLGSKPHQKERMRDEVKSTAADLLNAFVPNGKITENGVRININVALQYVERWISGLGAVALHNLMEDAATAEISRAQLWQWIRHGAKLDDGRVVTSSLYKTIRDEELSKLGGLNAGRYRQATEVLDKLILSEEFGEFLTTVAYQYLD